MNICRRVWNRFNALFRKQALDMDMEAEMRSHIEMRTQQNIEAGINPEEARGAALRQFGWIESIKEDCRDQRGIRWMENLIQDARYGTRQLVKNPAFTVVAVLTLALGIGVNTAIFSIVNAVLLQPLPYPDSDRLVWLAERERDSDSMPIAYPNFEDWRAQQNTFEQIGVYKWEEAVLTKSGEPLPLQGARVSSGLLAALAIQPLIGRTFFSEDDRPGSPPVVLISHNLWQSRFQTSPGALNNPIILDGHPHTIVGVMPRSFAFPDQLDYWVSSGPMAAEKGWQNRKNRPGLFGIARLKSGVSLQQAQADLDQIALRLEQRYPDSNKDRRVQLELLREYEVGGVRRSLWILLGAVGLVLLIACANIANLFLARSANRQKEMALRAALGASRSRMIRQLLTESMLVAIAGGIVGILFAGGSLRLFSSFFANGIPRSNEIALDALVLAVSSITALLTGLLFGLAPARQAARAEVQSTLKDASPGIAGHRSRLRHGLVVAEVALTLVLLVGSGLLLRSFHRLRTLDPGFVPQNVLTFQINLPQRKYEGPERSIVFYQALQEKLRTLPGVQAVAISSRLPLENSTRTTTYLVDGEPIPEPHERPSMNVQVVSPDYFRVAGTPVLRGRHFTEHDNREHLGASPARGDWASALNAIIIDEDFASRHWPNDNPIGRRIRMAFRDDAPWMTVVGIVPKVKWRRLNEEGGLVQAYLPFQQVPLHQMKVMIKSEMKPKTIAATIRQVVLSIDPDQPIHNVQTFAELLDRSTGSQRLNVTLLGSFGLMALALAIVGLYGVLAYAASLRRREIGVRMALGAQRRDVLGLIVGQGMKLAFVGTLIGTFGALALTRVLRNLLFQVEPTDPVTLIAIPLLLLAVSAIACWIPARNAAKADPVAALRGE